MPLQFVVACGSSSAGTAGSPDSTSAVPVAGEASTSVSSATATTLQPPQLQPPPPVGAGVMPWVDEPVTTIADTTTTLPTPIGPFCKPDALSIHLGHGGAAMGHEVVQVLLTNKGNDSCVLDGYPTVAGVAPDGSLVALHASRGSWFGDPGLPGAISPGESAAVNIDGSGACEQAQNGHADQSWKSLELGLPSGGSVRVAVEFSSVCGVGVSRFGVPTRQQPVEPTPTPSPLIAKLTAPATTHPGDSITYTVTLTNQTATPYRFESCPVYEEYLTTFTGPNDDAFPTVYDYRLNCAVGSSLAAGASITFQMILRVPANQPPGDAKFGWNIVGGAGPFSNAPMTVNGT
jgi:hypothetical protein